MHTLLYPIQIVWCGSNDLMKQVLEKSFSSSITVGWWIPLLQLSCQFQSLFIQLNLNGAPCSKLNLLYSFYTSIKQQIRNSKDEPSR